MRVIWDEQTGHANKADLVRPSRGDSTVYELWGNVEADNGRTYRVACYRNRHPLRSTGERNRFAMASDDVAIYVPAGLRGSRVLPESHLPDVRAFVLSAFKAAYRAALDVDFNRDAPGFPAADETKRPENLARRNAEAARQRGLDGSGGRTFNPEKPFRAFVVTPCSSWNWDFPTLEAARAYMAEQLERAELVLSGGAPAGPRSFDPLQSFIVWAEGVETLADAPWSYQADGARPYGGPWSKIPAPVALEVAETLEDAPAAPVEAPAPVRVVDVTPTWRGVLPALVAALEDGTAEGRRIAREELARMAEAADNWNASNARVAALEAIAIVANETAHHIPAGDARAEMDSALEAYRVTLA